MKKKTFYIPVEFMSVFSKVLAESNLENEVAGSTEDNNIIIDVYYEDDERMLVFELSEWVDNNIEIEEEEEEN